MRGEVFTQPQLEIVNYCAQECERQHYGMRVIHGVITSVYDMVSAWDYATACAWGNPEPDTDEITYEDVEEELAKQDRVPLVLTSEIIAHIGMLVEPIDNRKGFRKIPIFVGNEEKLKPEFIEKALKDTIDAYYEGRLIPARYMAKTAEDEFYYQFQFIHPFIDGNGRTGKILYNYLKGTLGSPVLPPNFWGILNL